MYNKIKITSEEKEMKNKKVFDFLKVIINILYFISMMTIGGYVGIKCVELEFIEFLSILLIAKSTSYGLLLLSPKSKISGTPF